MIAITREKVLEALGNVEEPDLKKDLVTLNMIQDIHIEGLRVSFSVILTTPGLPVESDDRECLPKCYPALCKQGCGHSYQHDLQGYLAKKYRLAWY